MSNTPPSAERFDATMAYYHQFRPTYPVALIKQIDSTLALNHKSIADIGAGTGLLTQALVACDSKLTVIEPNPQMLSFCKENLGKNTHLSYLQANAENTKLNDSSVDIIFCAQAFHWFDPIKTKQEFKRILKPHGWVALLWNMRNNSTPLMHAYETLLKEFGTDYQSVKAENIEDRDIEAFAEKAVMKITENHSQMFDWEGFKGRLLSTSYSPKEGDANFEAMITNAKSIFDEHQHQLQVSFDYQAVAYLFQL